MLAIPYGIHRNLPALGAGPPTPRRRRSSRCGEAARARARALGEQRAHECARIDPDAAASDSPR